MIGCFNRSVLLTYLGIALSAMGTASLFSGYDLDFAVICLILAGICDLFDGFVARRCKRNETQKKFGQQIDSLADTLSFLAFPAILLFYLTPNSTLFCLGADVVYLICGVDRLAWFNIGIDRFQNAFEGLPVTYSALLIPLFYAISKFVPTVLSFAPLLYLLIGLLFVLKIRIPKPRGIFYPFFALLAVGLIVFLLLK